ncbi:MAG: ornithine aminomutase subunit alpha [Bacilli bacterium]|nr:ornithine aminomutase subunit alpha [Bacilli bacterium]MBN2696735.1 ornithine aminomutase subunit alpha [Bacilli bacterium]
MSQTQIRPDDFASRRKHLEKLTDNELKAYFWSLADKTVSPLIELAKTHTTPAIERSVLLRMGFSSLEAGAIVEKTIQHHLIGKGAGHVVYKYAKLTDLSIRNAGLTLMNGEGWDEIQASFEVRK